MFVYRAEQTLGPSTHGSICIPTHKCTADHNQSSTITNPESTQPKASQANTPANECFNCASHTITCLPHKPNTPKHTIWTAHIAANFGQQCTIQIIYNGAHVHISANMIVHLLRSILQICWCVSEYNCACASVVTI